MNNYNSFYGYREPMTGPVVPDNNNIEEFYRQMNASHQIANPYAHAVHGQIPEMSIPYADPQAYMQMIMSTYPLMTSMSSMQLPMQPKMPQYETSSTTSLKRKSEYDDFDDDDDTGEEGKSDVGSRPSRRSSVRENSKYQREKRKTYINNLETTAKAISEDCIIRRHQLEEEYDTLCIIHQVLRSTSLEFLRLLLACECSEPPQESSKSWTELLENISFGGFEIIVPRLAHAYRPPSSTDIDDKETRLSLVTISQLNSYVAGLKIAYESIAKLGTNLADSLLFRLVTDKRSFFSTRNVVSVNAKVESFNAKLLGGLRDVTFIVFAKFTFSLNGDGDKIAKASIVFNTLDFHKQMSESFSPRIYFPITLKACKITGDASALRDHGQMITIMSDNGWIVSVQNDHAISILGNLSNKFLSFMNHEYFRQANEWIPYSGYISKQSDYNHTNNDLFISDASTYNSTCIPVKISPADDIYIRILPYLDERVLHEPLALLHSKDSSSSLLGPSIHPNRCLWIISRCRPMNQNIYPIYLIYDFLEHVLDLFEKNEDDDMSMAYDKNYGSIHSSNLRPTTNTHGSYDEIHSDRSYPVRKISWKQETRKDINGHSSSNQKTTTEQLSNNNLDSSPTTSSSGVIQKSNSTGLSMPMDNLMSDDSTIRTNEMSCNSSTNAFDFSNMPIFLKLPKKSIVKRVFIQISTLLEKLSRALIEDLYHYESFPPPNIQSPTINPLGVSRSGSFVDLAIDSSDAMNLEDKKNDDGQPNSLQSIKISRRIILCMGEFLVWVNMIDHLSISEIASNESIKKDNPKNFHDNNAAAMLVTLATVAATTSANYTSKNGISSDNSNAMESIADGSANGALNGPPDVMKQMKNILETNQSLTNDEMEVIHTISSELHQFFEQIRLTKLIPRLLHHFHRPSLESEEIKTIEAFLCLCWGRHTNPTIQKHLRNIRDLLPQKKYEEALEAASQIIELDKNFAEGYSKRATVYLSLKQAQECFNDITMTLKLEPTFYGAYCGKGLMLMKLGDYTAALNAFKEAISINPTLERGSLASVINFCHDRIIIKRSQERQQLSKPI